jgi:CheY-like chemotaxis protein
MRILIVDDDEVVLLVLHDMLAGIHDRWEIAVAQSGTCALLEFREQSFDLVVTDVRMPEMNGIELTEALRALDSNTAVIWITAYGGDEVAEEAARLGVDVCLDKPVQITALRQAVQDALCDSQSRDQE